MTAELVLGGVDAARADASAAVVPTSREEAFRELYRAEYGGLAGYCTSLTGDVQLARDITQEAFARLFARWITVREPKAYVYYVATNLARRHWRRSKREREIYDEIGHRPTADAAVYDPWLRDLVERLPERLREAVLLHYYADLPVTEVALLTKRPVGTVKRRLHEARQLLATALEGQRD
jgi:RNA polymerase sigma-70 factor (ECF subfamily)